MPFRTVPEMFDPMNHSDNPSANSTARRVVLNVPSKLRPSTCGYTQ